MHISYLIHEINTHFQHLYPTRCGLRTQYGAIDLRQHLSRSGWHQAMHRPMLNQHQWYYVALTYDQFQEQLYIRETTLTIHVLNHFHVSQRRKSWYPSLTLIVRAGAGVVHLRGRQRFQVKNHQCLRHGSAKRRVIKPLGIVVVLSE